MNDYNDYTYTERKTDGAIVFSIQIEITSIAINDGTDRRRVSRSLARRQRHHVKNS